MRSIILVAAILSQGHIRMLYNSLDPTSLHEHLAFWELYPETEEGQRALDQVKSILQVSTLSPHSLKGDFQGVLEGMVALVNKSGDNTLPELSTDTLEFIESVARTLPNRKLKGHYVRTEEEVLALPPEEIDLARGLFLSEMGAENYHKIRTYEALLDLMALQVKARLSPEATNKEKITLINRYIFDELGFRFPPHSCYSEDIDLYTFLPSVMDSRRGVCLGISILYITLAQRLDLPLEMVTPPGHIYIRSGDTNIETTLRGVHLDSSVYLGVDTRSLQIRDIKEVIGMAHFNQAAVYWRRKEPKKAIQAYSRARPYLNEDPLLLELLAYNYLLDGDEAEGRAYLEKVRDHLPDHAVSKNNVPDDYLSGKADAEALAAVYQEVDEKRSSLLNKKESLEKTLKKFPEFKAAWFALASTYLQLHRTKEAYATLKSLHALSAEDATVEYYLAALSAEREAFPDAWRHLKNAEALAAKRGHKPKPLLELRRQLSVAYPDPLLK